jgi:hypothetical protein
MKYCPLAVCSKILNAAVVSRVNQTGGIAQVKGTNYEPAGRAEEKDQNQTLDKMCSC